MYLSCGVTGFTVALVKDWRLGLALLAMLPCLVGISLIFARTAIGFTIQIMSMSNQANTLAEEALGSVRTVQSLCAEKDLSHKYNDGIARSLRLGRKRAIAIAGCMAGFTLVIYCGYSLAFYLGAILVRSGRTSPGNVITVFLSVMMGSFALAQIPSNIQGFVSARASFASLTRIIERTPTIHNPVESRLTLPCGPVHIAFNNVTFAYPSRPDRRLLEKFSLNFPAGSSTAVIGPSGAGKSTILALLERFYDPQDGTVLVGGHDVRDFELKYLRGSVLAYVPQEPSLFQASILENVGYGISPTLNESTEQRRYRIESACRLANAHDFIMALPDRYNTQVGQGGLELSGGQRARIAIARAVVADPRVLLLDEITSNLDALSEQAVNRGLEGASKGRTTILVTHRQSSLPATQRVVVINHGRKVAEGTLADVRKDESIAGLQLFGCGMAKESDVEQLGTSKEVSSPDDQLLPINPYSKDVDDAEKGNTNASIGGVTNGRLRMLWRLSAGSRTLIAGGIVGCGVAGMIYPVFAILYANAYIDLDIGAASATDQNRNALWFFVAALVGGGGVFLQNVCLSIASEHLAANLQTTVFATLLQKPISFIDSQSPGGLLSTLNSSTEAIQNVTGSSVGNVISSFLTLICGAIVAISYNWKFALVNLCLTPITLLTGYCRLKTIDAKEGRLAKAHEPAVRLACEATTSIRTVALLAREESVHKEFAAHLAIPHRYVKRMALLDSGLFALSQTNMFLVIAMGFWYGSVLISQGQLNAHDFFVGFMAIVSGSFQCVNLFSQTPQLSQAKEGAGKIVEMLADSGADPFTAPSGVSPAFDSALTLSDVRFGYPSRRGNALEGVGLEVAPGSYTALCGPSGSGKSTILALIERFYSPHSGQITLGKHTIGSSPVTQYRSRIALVTQEPVLYSASIRDNLVLGLPKDLMLSQTQGELEKAIHVAMREANIHQTIEGLPEGLETHIGSRGVQLSGGQRQRLVLARSLLRRPALLLLDEATSSLDARSERLIQTALDSGATTSQRTTICVAHRLATIRQANNIFVLADGRVVDSGTFEELANRDGLFREMLQQQNAEAVQEISSNQSKLQM
ncbi:P-loop containing nucleoside triphosphate hydrolase protein [Tilletiaria anomala UBC 951]|uniref:p-loop containing nucleoside triphosphate hydrolase protein n=1 Tax=Tilletiaria anomala (strain ATCC 24038 / CBS 436.72 / UBC 951) TaxID=1037660 RepID=A0A066W0A2_TILAU|nr:P-loop containing nucleoside triphosphate hydrolase protein [Tilletiaria anomala UBC 951]KDN47176.1 P-loop containing nucleoside triphosphate hydrolase protein [Tilletiaria anomala UBC 951]